MEEDPVHTPTEGQLKLTSAIFYEMIVLSPVPAGPIQHEVSCLLSASCLLCLQSSCPASLSLFLFQNQPVCYPCLHWFSPLASIVWICLWSSGLQIHSGSGSSSFTSSHKSCHFTSVWRSIGSTLAPSSLNSTRDHRPCGWQHQGLPRPSCFAWVRYHFGTLAPSVSPFPHLLSVYGQGSTSIDLVPVSRSHGVISQVSNIAPLSLNSVVGHRPCSPLGSRLSTSAPGSSLAPQPSSTSWFFTPSPLMVSCPLLAPRPPPELPPPQLDCNGVRTRLSGGGEMSHVACFDLVFSLFCSRFSCLS